MVKKDVKSKVAAKKWLVNGKNFNNNNSGEFLCRLVLAKNSPKLPLLKVLPLTYHHSHFLAATLDFTSYFIIAFLRAALVFFTAWLFWIRFHFFLYLYTIGRLWDFFNLFFFSLPQEEEKMKQMHFKYLILSVNVQIIYIIHIFITEFSMVVSL